MTATVIVYERAGDLVHLKLQNLTNHELREVLIGLWCRLDNADREDHIKALNHYSDDLSAYLSPIAQAVKFGTDGEQTIILSTKPDTRTRP